MHLKKLVGLYAITPGSLAGAALTRKVEAALAGGVRLVQYRDKVSSPAERAQEAATLNQLCQRYGAQLLVNDDAKLARAVGAAGVHLGQSDARVADVRAAWPEAIIGATCHNDLALARAAHADGASYIALGAFYASSVKPHAVRATLDLIGRTKATTGLPVCAIGGITLARAPQLIAAGADMLAVITDLFDAPEVSHQARAYCQLFPTSP
jgi:thiamine-phosphate pyrophosphorylase